MAVARVSSHLDIFLLAAIGGCVDAVGVLTLGGLFVSHMSGNSAAFAAFFGQGEWQSALPHIFAVPVFVAGLLFGYYWTVGTPDRRRCAMVLFIEAMLLAAFLLLMAFAGEPSKGTTQYFAFALLPLFAMGMQNATLKKVGNLTFHTTYVTGVLDTIGESAAQILRLRKKQTPEDAVLSADAFIVFKSALSVWLFYIAGALYGSAGLLVCGVWVLVPAVVFLLVLAARSFKGPRRPVPAA